MLKIFGELSIFTVSTIGQLNAPAVPPRVSPKDVSHCFVHE